MISRRKRENKRKEGYCIRCGKPLNPKRVLECQECEARAREILNKTIKNAKIEHNHRDKALRRDGLFICKTCGITLPVQIESKKEGRCNRCKPDI